MISIRLFRAATFADARSVLAAKSHSIPPLSRTIPLIAAAGQCVAETTVRDVEPIVDPSPYPMWRF